MRELKFRAWLKNYSCYAEVLGFDRGKLIVHCQTGELVMHRLHVPLKDCILEQYTGLKEKNGKEIYEGDIVNAIGIGIAQVIDSPSGEWMLYYKREPDEIKNGFACVVPKNKPSGLWKANTTSYIDVIGNIHEDAELLEEE